MKRILLLLVIMISAAAGTYGAARSDLPDDLQLSIGAAHLAQGRTYAAESEDSFGVFANPASLGNIRSFQAVSMYSKYLSEYDRYLLGVVFPWKDNMTLGIGYTSQSLSDIPETGIIAEGSADERIIDLGRRFGSGERSLIIASAMTLRRMVFQRLYLAGAFKLTNQFVDTRQRYGYGLTAGLLIPQVISDDLSLGLTCFNLFSSGMRWSAGEPKEYEEMRLRLGAGYLLTPEWKLSLDLENGKAYLGTSYDLMNAYAFRAGIADSSYTLGMGMTFNKVTGFDFNDLALTLDYAFEYDDTRADLPGAALNHYFSISITQVQETPRPVQSIKGQIVETSEPFYMLTGTAADNALITIYRNEVLVTRVSADTYGVWEAQIPLENGTNIVC